MTCPLCHDNHTLSQCPRWRGRGCNNCARALAGMWCGYSAACEECTARAIARGLDAFNALHPHGTGVREPLRELIQRALPSIPYDEARRAVWRWWTADHPEAKAYAA